MKKSSIILLLSLAAGTFFAAESRFLMKDGKAECEIVLPENAPAHEQFAAQELSSYLGKIAADRKPAIVKKATGKKYPVTFVRNNKNKELKKDGFILNIDKQGLRIEYSTEVAALYGAYEILKKYGGILWLLPGADGEYYKVKPTIEVPEIRIVCNPYRTLRSGNGLGITKDGRLWLVRNYMNVPATIDAFKQNREFRSLGSKIYAGFHCYSKLLVDEPSDWKKINAKLDALYKVHPEYFPLVNGKRVNLINTTLGYSDKQPCTSNKDVIRIMKKNLEKMIEKIKPDGVYCILNNDGMIWCECENCKKLDSQVDRKENFVSSRYFALYRELTKDIFKKYPDMKIIGCAYQNYQAPPSDEKLWPKHGRLQLTYNPTCWRHRMDDPTCPTNKVFHQYYQTWHKTGLSMSSWEQISHPGRNFLPLEFSIRDRLKYYDKIDCEMFPEVWPPNITYPILLKQYQNKMVFHQWETIWQGIYYMANYQWNKNFDFDSNYEKINALYYGKGWKGGMKELRAFLVKTFHATSGCAGYCHYSPLGRMLEKPGVRTKILALFDKAEKAAAEDPDKRALAHVKKDRMFFEKTWVKEYESYVSNFREITIYKKKGQIKIDGKLDEKDWENANVISRFHRAKKLLPDNEQTYVRITYDHDNLYFAIEAMEPSPEKIVAKMTKHDDPVWKENTLEIFLNYPDMADAYYQLAFNALGTCFDWGVDPGKGKNLKFNANAEVKTRILKDRWVLEARIPTASLGAKCMEGGMWKMDVVRRRLLTDGTDVASSWGKYREGAFVSMFQNVNFAGERRMDTATKKDAETRFFPNGSLDEIHKLEGKTVTDRRIARDWKVVNDIVPAGWHITNAPGAKDLMIEMIKHPNTDHNYYMKTSGTGQIHQYTKAPVKKAKVSFKLKGNATVLISLSRYTKKDGKVKFQTPSIIHTYKVNSEDWRNYSFDYDSGGEEQYLVWSLITRSGTVCVDDVMIIPQN